MNILTHADPFRELPGPIVLAAGFFDGIHKGHQSVLLDAIRRAREINGQAWALTFDRHPLSVLSPDKAPAMLSTREERLEHFAALGMDGVLMLPFTRQLAALDPEAFVQRLCRPTRTVTHGLSEIRCGANWRFGAYASGTPELLAKFGERYGFHVVIVSYARYQGEEISSTRIRQAIRDGALRHATAMLGRPYSVQGTVVHGYHRGTKLGFPTANLKINAEVLPPDGIYATLATLSGKTYPAVSNLGINPTFRGAHEQHVLETHVLDYTGGDLYAQPLRVAFVAGLRDEIKFDTEKALVEQIGRDCEAARAQIAQQAH
ncbi:MAG: riboflavin biosynthesis protein RibF [Clostridia bacterium]|nr:riboflavin biosynthesis protein RibF [Clostridia bacterium]